MTLNRNALLGYPSDEEKKLKAWTSCQPIPGLPLGEWRFDCHGKAIKWADHGVTSSEHGWEVDHVAPTALGGPDTLDNVRALHWRTNRQLGGMVGNALKRGFLGSPRNAAVGDPPVNALLGLMTRRDR